MNEMVAQNKFFTAYNVTESVTRIMGLAMECCYIIEGTERALLIDGLTGIGSLKAFVRDLTELPVTVAITHAHMDHTGVAWESDSIYLHPDDIFLLYSEEESHKKRCLDFVNLFLGMGVPCRTKPTVKDVLAAHPLRTYPIRDGDVIDLGGIQIEVIAVPGHTRGTIVFLDRSNRIVYAGDACNANTLLNLNGSTSIEEYKDSLEHLWSYESAFDVLWSGHDHTSIPKQIISDGIALCNRILTRTDDAVETEDMFGGKSYIAARRGDGYLIVDGGLCNIVYKAETIYESKSPTL